MPIHVYEYPNGLTLVAEEIGSLESAAFTFLIPLGAAYDPADRAGLGGMVCEMIQRGCGPRSSRQFLDDLELLGVEGGESVAAGHTSYSGATLAENLIPGLRIYADMLLRPHLPDDQLEAGRQVALQELRGVEDEPSQRAMQELQRRHYPAPWGQPSTGSVAGVEAITIGDVREQWRQGYRPNGAILGVAGRFDWKQLTEEVGAMFADWQPVDRAEPDYGASGPRRDHLDFDSNQTHVCLAYDSVPYRDADYYRAWAAVRVLSGGSSARLFSEVREKRGLCYTVYAVYGSLKNRGSVMCYAGTSADRAQETLDVMTEEVLKLSQGVRAEELDRLKARMKSILLMQQESSSSRSSSIAVDWYHLRKVRPLDEISRIIDELSPEGVNQYLESHPPQGFTLFTLGPSALEAPHGIS